MQADRGADLDFLVARAGRVFHARVTDDEPGQRSLVSRIRSDRVGLSLSLAEQWELPPFPTMS